MPDQAAAGNHIREWREYRNMTQEDVADRLSDVLGHSVALQTVSKLELGRRQLTLKWLHALSLALECSRADLLERSPYEAFSSGRRPGRPGEGEDMAQAEQLILQALRRLQQGQQRVIDTIVARQDALERKFDELAARYTGEAGEPPADRRAPKVPNG